ncbi:hypothetical protein B0H19DRAFT_1135481 [Mycena capillaripes]|nr:hypothetical protein B0H19DRAFT_1135481 [Mycena capillaripes]
MQETLAASIAGTDRFPQPIPQDPPLSFTWICSEWRIISINTPELWEAIRVDDKTLLVPLQVVSLWGSRTANRPRDIQLQTYDPERGAALLAKDMESCQRWRDISLMLPVQSFAALVAYNGPFPMLQVFSLSISQGYEGVTIPVRNAPLLRKLMLQHFPTTSVDTAWNQLTTLDVTVDDVESAISALQACSNLTDLRFSVRDRRVRSLILRPVTLPSLRSLHILGYSILRFLTIPHLTRLEARLWVSNFIDQLATELPALLARSGACPFTQLSFQWSFNLSNATFRGLLAAAGSVTEFQLTFHQNSAATALRDVLHDQSEGDPVLPLLTTLRVRIGHVESTEELFEPLLETLRSRREVVVHGQAVLEVFCLELDPPAVLPSGVRDRLLAFRDVGMHVVIDYKS